MKKMFSFFLLITAAFSMITAMGLTVSAAETVTINVYNWGEYISDGSDDTLDVNKAFEEKYPNIKVNYTMYTSNEDLYAKLKSGASNYDIIIPSDYMIGRMIEEDMLEKIDTSKLENYKYISEQYKNLPYDPNNEYSVPYNVGMVGVIYNTMGVDEEDTGSWDLLWNAKYSGQILNFMNSRDGFATAQFILGQSINSTDKSDWDKAFEKLKEQKPILQGYVMDEIFIKMQGGNALIAPYYAGDFFTMYSENEDLAFYYPEEGTNFFVDAICIPKGAKHVEEAMLYIDFLLSEEVAIANAEYICYASPNTQVINNEDYLAYLDELHPDAKAILYPDLTDYKTQSYLNLPLEMREYEVKLWEELMIYGNSDVGIYIVAAVFAVMIIAFASYSFVIKKIHSRY